MELKDLVKNEVKFLQEQETPFNEHGACIFISQDTHMQVDLQYFLLEYKNWLVERKLVQLYKNEFNIANVSGRSEQLTALVQWLEDNHSIKIHDMILQDYLKYGG